MISGIHLATALSVMLHMEQEGNGMDTNEIVEALREYALIDECEGGNPSVIATERAAADRLSEQQQVIDGLVSAMPDLHAVITWLDNGCAPKMASDELKLYRKRIDSALSKAKGHTKDAD